MELRKLGIAINDSKENRKIKGREEENKGEGKRENRECQPQLSS